MTGKFVLIGKMKLYGICEDWLTPAFESFRKAETKLLHLAFDSS